MKISLPQYDLLDCSFTVPEENLACDEALLDRCESGSSGPVLRFWESPVYFVVLGYANRISEEVHLEACHELGIPVLRRVSGGGTVLQGPGCLNYSLIMPIEDKGPLSTVTGTNHLVMTRLQEALQPCLTGTVKVEGYTDLTWKGKKFSGNSQRRKKSHLLFHGTFLLDFDIPLIEKTLQLPKLKPEYRKDCSHLEFLTNIPVTRNQIKESLCRTWNTGEPGYSIPEQEIRVLMEEKYLKREWHTSR